MSRQHHHEFSLLWWNFGPHGPQDMHLHPCAPSCRYELVAKGRDCDGNRNSHQVRTLTQARRLSEEQRA